MSRLNKLCSCGARFNVADNHDICPLCTAQADIQHYAGYQAASECEACVALARTVYFDRRTQFSYFKKNGIWKGIRAIRDSASASPFRDLESVTDDQAKGSASDGVKSSGHGTGHSGQSRPGHAGRGNHGGHQVRVSAPSVETPELQLTAPSSRKPVSQATGSAPDGIEPPVQSGLAGRTKSSRPGGTKSGEARGSASGVETLHHHDGPRSASSVERIKAAGPPGLSSHVRVEPPVEVPPQDRK